MNAANEERNDRFDDLKRDADPVMGLRAAAVALAVAAPVALAIFWSQAEKLWNRVSAPGQEEPAVAFEEPEENVGQPRSEWMAKLDELYRSDENGAFGRDAGEEDGLAYADQTDRPSGLENFEPAPLEEPEGVLYDETAELVDASEEEFAEEPTDEPVDALAENDSLIGGFADDETAEEALEEPVVAEEPLLEPEEAPEEFVADEEIVPDPPVAQEAFADQIAPADEQTIAAEEPLEEDELPVNPTPVVTESDVFGDFFASAEKQEETPAPSGEVAPLADVDPQEFADPPAEAPAAAELVQTPAPDPFAEYQTIDIDESATAEPDPEPIDPQLTALAAELRRLDANALAEPSYFSRAAGLFGGQSAFSAYCFARAANLIGADRGYSPKVLSASVEIPAPLPALTRAPARAAQNAQHAVAEEPAQREPAKTASAQGTGIRQTGYLAGRATSTPANAKPAAPSDPRASQRRLAERGYVGARVERWDENSWRASGVLRNGADGKAEFAQGFGPTPESAVENLLSGREVR